MSDKVELNNWRSQIVTSNNDKMGLRRQPYAFTEQGASLKDLGKKWFAFSKMDMEVLDILKKLNNKLTGKDK